MAILGGGIGGAGNPLGGSFTGTAQALEFLEHHCYGYSGVIASTGSGAPDSTMLSFTTGNHYIVAKINWGTDSVGSDTMFITVDLNDTTVFLAKYDNQPSMNDDQPIRIIIPSYTKVFVGMDSGASGRQMSVQLTGRVYRRKE